MAGCVDDRLNIKILNIGKNKLSDFQTTGPVEEEQPNRQRQNKKVIRLTLGICLDDPIFFQLFDRLVNKLLHHAFQVALKARFHPCRPDQFFGLQII